jgi:hypothetical protein
MKIHNGLTSALILLSLSACSSSSNDGGAASYRLTTSFLGPEASLVAGALVDEPDTALAFTSVTGDTRIEWFITPLDSGFFRITNRALGDSLSLDIVNSGDMNQLTMTDSSNVTGQRWQITPLNNGFCRLTTEFLGPDISLDVTNPNEIPYVPIMRPTSNVTGQFWQFTALGGDADPVLTNCTGNLDG